MRWNKQKKEPDPYGILTPKELEYLRQKLAYEANRTIDKLNYQRYLDRYGVDNSTHGHLESTKHANRYGTQGWHAVYYRFMRIHQKNWEFPEALVDYQNDSKSVEPMYLYSFSLR